MGVAGWIAWVIATGHAHADLTVTAQVYVTRGPVSLKYRAPVTGSQTLTLYFKDNMALADVKNGPLIVFNGRHNHAYLIDRQNSSYLARDIIPIQSARMPAAATSESSSMALRIDSSTPKRVVAGYSSSAYRITGSVGASDISKTVSVTGEIWSSEQLVLPTDNMSILTALAAQLVADSEEIQRLLASQLFAQHDFPLKSIICLARGVSHSRINRRTTVVFNVVSVDTHDVDPALFVVPGGLHESDGISNRSGSPQDITGGQRARFQDFGAGGAAGGNPGDMGPGGGPPSGDSGNGPPAPTMDNPPPLAGGGGPGAGPGGPPN